MAEIKVRYNYLGKSGTRVANLCLGTMTFGTNEKSFMTRPNQASEDLSFQIMDKYAELGGNFLDTANLYSLGRSEEIVGNWLKRQQRSKFVLATKVGCRVHADDVTGNGLSRRNIVQSVEESLERMQTNYIDLYQSHFWDSATSIDETLRTFDDLIRCGKIRHYGASNCCGWQFQKLVCRIEAMGLNNCVSLQQQYNLLDRQSELEEFMVCKNEGIGVLPWSPLKGGLLTGKFKRNVKPDAANTRIGFIAADERRVMSTSPAWKKYESDETYWTLIDTLRTIADKYGKSIPQVALRWLLQQDVVASVIIGATSVEQLENNMGAGRGWVLTDDEIGQLNDVSPRVNLYPYAMVYSANSTRQNIFNRSNKI